MRRVYLDNAATTQISLATANHFANMLNNTYGNPSSILYEEGYDAYKFLKKAREDIESLFKVGEGGHIYFTSGGTESDNWAIKGIAWANKDKGNHIITSKIEHHAILKSCEFLEKWGFKITYLDVDSNGLVNPQDVANAITDKTILISIMMANNEIGTIEPVKEISKIAHDRNVLMHTDAVQAVKHMPVNIEDLGVDLLSFSAHKFHGPKGVGGLYVRDGVNIEPLLHGGSQEGNMRASTVNLPGIVGMACALEIGNEHLDSQIKFMQEMRQNFLQQILSICPNAKLIGHPSLRLCNNLNIMFPEVEAETLVLLLDHEGVSASTGSACNTGSLEPSHVLRAIGLSDKEAHSCVRFSLDSSTTKEDIKYAVKAIGKVLKEYTSLYI